MAPPLGGARAEAHGRKPEQYGDRTPHGLCNPEEASFDACAGEAEGQMADLRARGAGPRPPSSRSLVLETPNLKPQTTK